MPSKLNVVLEIQATGATSVVTKMVPGFRQAPVWQGTGNRGKQEKMRDTAGYFYLSRQ